MNKITEKILEKFPYDSFSNADITNLLNSSRNSTYGRVKRAIANKEIIHIRRGLYCLSKRFQRKGINSYALAQLIYGPSYISLESALEKLNLLSENYKSGRIEKFIKGIKRDLGYEY